jgi:hypothetical protein
MEKEHAMNMINGTDNAKIAYGMREMARTHKNDLISVNLARVAGKVAGKGAAWAGSPMTEIDNAIVKYYLDNK